MGATLPVVARWVEATPTGVSWLGYFYGGNLAGAVAGSLLAGFYLLRLYDMPTATYGRGRAERARGGARAGGGDASWTSPRADAACRARRRRPASASSMSRSRCQG